MDKGYLGFQHSMAGLFHVLLAFNLFLLSSFKDVICLVVSVIFSPLVPFPLYLIPWSRKSKTAWQHSSTIARHINFGEPLWCVCMSECLNGLVTWRERITPLTLDLCFHMLIHSRKVKACSQQTNKKTNCIWRLLVSRGISRLQCVAVWCRLSRNPYDLCEVCCSVLQCVAGWLEIIMP